MRLATFRDVEIEVRKLWAKIAEPIVQEKVVETKTIETVRVEEIDSVKQGNSVLHRLRHIFTNNVEIDTLDLVTSAKPTITNVVPFGTAALRFKEIYLKEWDFLDDIIPRVNEAADLGSSTYRVRKLYTKDIYISSVTASKPLLVDASKNIISRAINLSTTEVSNILAVSNGGTGLSSLTADYVVVGNGTSAVQLIAGVGSIHSVPSAFSVGSYNLQYKDHSGTNQTLTVLTSFSVLTYRSYEFSKGVLIATS